MRSFPTGGLLLTVDEARRFAQGEVFILSGQGCEERFLREVDGGVYGVAPYSLAKERALKDFAMARKEQGADHDKWRALVSFMMPKAKQLSGLGKYDAVVDRFDLWPVPPEADCYFHFWMTALALTLYAKQSFLPILCWKAGYCEPVRRHRMLPEVDAVAVAA